MGLHGWDRSAMTCGISIQIALLSQRLKRLIEWGLVRREPYQNRPVRHKYYLTEEGKSLEPVLPQIMAWGHAHLGGGLYDPKQKKTVRMAR
jgi:DNA-binding HxlR family transcriptional regulator